MSVLKTLFGPQADTFQRALSATTKRHTALSANLANLNTPGYKRQDFDFNISLDEAEAHRKEMMGELNGGQNAGGASLRLDGNNVDLEQEVMSLAETELRYQAVTDMASSYFSGMKNVIREGR